MADLDVPIALRRPRRSAVGVKMEAEATPLPESVPKTPRRQRKAVRFSDPGPSLANATAGEASSSSSGLTPFIRRTSIATPKRRRASTPARASRGGTPVASQAPALTYATTRPSTSQVLHQTADGRVERRIRRGNLRDLLNKLEHQKKHNAKVAQSQISHLRAEVKARDREIYELQNATVVIDTDRIWGLEQQIEDLRDELRKKEAAATIMTPNNHTRSYDWTMAARDPFADDFMDTMPDDDHFGDATMAHFVASTPSRARSSFPTPPATSPNVPATPCSRGFAATPKSHAGVQASLPDPAKQELEEELASLNLEISKLTATMDTYRGLHARLSEHISSAITSSADDFTGASPVEALENRVQLLVQTMSDRTAALTQLNSSINDLGFPGSDAGEMIVSLASGFRAARLELEYLTPGEIALPLTSHGAEVLDLLLTRLRVLAKKAQEDEASIDEYHEIEQSLRKQLDARVSVMDGLKAEMSKAERLMNEKNLKIQELQIGNDRLKGAVDGYIRDMSELERLVERMDQEGKDAVAAHMAQQRSDAETLASKEASIADLEQRLEDAVRQTATLQRELSEVQDSSTRHVVSLNKRHGASLALRDARVLELRSEVDRVNGALRAAHEMIRVLRVDKGGLEARMAEERAKAKEAMDAMKGELQRVLQMSQEFLASPKQRPAPGGHGEVGGGGGGGEESSSPVVRVVARPGRFLAGGLARRSSKSLKRGRDSGMGLLEEDEVDI
ncbi:glycosyl hydrolase [Purpureocillium lavendulum]|uniref:Glycosyl hydrolase n=1 Tax=Purpureocillium lavendulum TaxID=1247861 RepID=A0AB34FPD1_9HYPO|nr:glycosyl hydrolase [Purpureocillium lavendulum]